jgi:hypothetical protein
MTTSSAGVRACADFDKKGLTRMAVDVLGEAVQNDVGAEEERGLVERREESVVDQDKGPRGV